MARGIEFTALLLLPLAVLFSVTYSSLFIITEMGGDFINVSFASAAASTFISAFLPWLLAKSHRRRWSLYGTLAALMFIMMISYIIWTKAFLMMPAWIILGGLTGSAIALIITTFLPRKS